LLADFFDSKLKFVLATYEVYRADRFMAELRRSCLYSRW